jgi:CheY-like chemotaxis protein
MPELDGFQLCLEVRRDPRLARIPVLLLSFQYVDDSDLELARKVGATRFIPRPMRARELIDAVIGILADEIASTSPEPLDVVREAHVHRVTRQLERQMVLSAALAESCTIQATQLSLLGGMADALAHGAVVDNVVHDLLPGCLDAAGISKGALFLSQSEAGGFSFQSAVGFDAEGTGRLQGFFGCLPLLHQVFESGLGVCVPSTGVPPEITQRLLSGAGTPLTALQLQLTRLRRLAHGDNTRDDLAAQVASKVDVLQGQLDRLEVLVAALLDVNRIEAGRVRLRLERVDLEQVVRAAIRRAEEQLTDSIPAISLTAAGPVVGLWDPFWIDAIVTNLLSNAIKFSHNAPIDVVIDADGHKSRLIVTDHGIGIAASGREPARHRRDLQGRAAPRSRGLAHGRA